MNRNRRKLSFPEKIGVIGSVASIIGLAIVFWPSTTPTTTAQSPVTPTPTIRQTSEGDQSTQIGIIHGDVTINPAPAPAPSPPPNPEPSEIDMMEAVIAAAVEAGARRINKNTLEIQNFAGQAQVSIYNFKKIKCSPISYGAFQCYFSSKNVISTSTEQYNPLLRNLARQETQSGTFVNSEKGWTKV